MLKVKTPSQQFGVDVHKFYLPRTKRDRKVLSNAPEGIDKAAEQMMGNNPNIGTEVKIYEIPSVEIPGAVMSEDPLMVGRGSAVKGPRDDYDPWIGKKYAFGRAINSMNPAPGKVARTMLWQAFVKRFKDNGGNSGE